ncbi:glycosyltransferase family 2 protein [Aquibaculum arenosum]|uniref:Glycosyltransferase family 2 protein n=1 Tax=Aquibaculum arenosum TaxID=3032591 RepID=A0ABT5YHR4_9PROT|nr:glycosyltransferase family 2 protein [Fodinicurvata sp. CAU 1616]MDF2094476.1 glycosyltransferase family 2 protein [Fodinicurvata sp. CAU 1616]
MKALTATLGFHRAMRKHRYSEALAVHRDQALFSRGPSYWAQYKLGLYRSVHERAEREGVPARWRARLAAAVCAAALGKGEAAQAWLQGLPAGKLRQIVTALAPHAPELALRRLQEADAAAVAECRDLQIALLTGLGHLPEAAAVLGRLSDEEEARWPELPLHRATLLLAGQLPASATPEAAALAQINRYFAHHQLESLERRDEAEALNARNARAQVPVLPGERPLVSVIMTAFRTKERIGPAIESLLAQSHRNLEIIVMDDASDDGLGAVVAALRERDARVHYHRLPRNVGTYVAKNLALRHLARGAFVTCHDSDDWSHPRKIEQQLDWLQEDPGRVFSWSYWLRIRDDGAVVARQCHPLLRANLSSILFRREAVLNRAGAFDEVRTGADSEFLARLALVFGREAGAPLRKPLALGAERPGSLMTDHSTGIQGSGTTPFRLEYWEAWRAWHGQCLAAGRRPFMPQDPGERPFPISAEQAVPKAPDLAAHLT